MSTIDVLVLVLVGPTRYGQRRRLDASAVSP